MAFQFTPLHRRKPKPYVADPSKLTTSMTKRQPNYQYDYKSLPEGATQIRRQTTAQANRPPVPTFTPHRLPTEGTGARMYNIARMPAGTNVAGPQFPWQMRRGISSDASRQAAFRYGFGSGEGRTGFARKSVDTFFDPRYMFDPRFRKWALQQQVRMQY